MRSRPPPPGQLSPEKPVGERPGDKVSGEGVGEWAGTEERGGRRRGRVGTFMKTHTLTPRGGFGAVASAGRAEGGLHGDGGDLPGAVGLLVRHQHHVLGGEVAADGKVGLGARHFLSAPQGRRPCWNCLPAREWGWPFWSGHFKDDTQFCPNNSSISRPGTCLAFVMGGCCPPPRHALESKCGNLSKFLSKLNCLFKPPPPSTPNLPHTMRQLKQCRGRGFLPKMAICKPRRTAAGPPHVPPWGRSGGPPPPCPGKPAVVERTGVF